MKSSISRKFVCFVLSMASAALWPFGLASASTLSYSFEGPDFGSSGWTLVGNSFYAHDVGLSPPDRLRLNYAGLGQFGSAWLNAQQFSPQMDWSVFLRGQFSYQTNSGADGMSLIWQTDGLSANPDFTGYGLLRPYLAITLDSYYNPGDPYGNGLMISTSTGLVGWLNLGNALEISDFFNLNASYSHYTNILSITFDSDARTPVSGDFNVNLGTLFGTNTNATVGFSARSGGAWENHDVLQASVQAVPTSQVPESATLLLLGSGITVLIARRRKLRKPTRWRGSTE